MQNVRTLFSFLFCYILRHFSLPRSSVTLVLVLFKTMLIFARNAERFLLFRLSNGVILERDLLEQPAFFFFLKDHTIYLASHIEHHFSSATDYIRHLYFRETTSFSHIIQ